ncbi:hypothetical protein DIE19_15435 [Burkholderia sp. Bp9126]|nr:hypothetical protein DIE19_15435 [Burkholderia sp. Bp9126]
MSWNSSGGRAAKAGGDETVRSHSIASKRRNASENRAVDEFSRDLIGNRHETVRSNSFVKSASNRPKNRSIAQYLRCNAVDEYMPDSASRFMFACHAMIMRLSEDPAMHHQNRSEKAFSGRRFHNCKLFEKTLSAY